MEDKKTVALVSITVNAVQPMMQYIRKNETDFKVVNYLDGYLMEKIKQEGGISPESMNRFTDMIGKAFRDGADGVITTCTVFSPYTECFSKLYKKPVVPADTAMLDNASKCEGKTAIICTFQGTVETTRNAYFECRRKNKMPEEVDMYTVTEAFNAAQRGEMAESDRIVAEKIQELDSLYDQIVLAQISMAGAAELVTLQHAKLFTSPREAMGKLKEQLKSI